MSPCTARIRQDETRDTSLRRGHLLPGASGTATVPVARVGVRHGCDRNPRTTDVNPSNNRLESCRSAGGRFMEGHAKLSRVLRTGEAGLRRPRRGGSGTEIHRRAHDLRGSEFRRRPDRPVALSIASQRLGRALRRAVGGTVRTGQASRGAVRVAGWCQLRASESLTARRPDSRHGQVPSCLTSGFRRVDRLLGCWE